MQIARRLVAGEIARVSMTGSDAAILLEEIAIGAARGIQLALHFVHVISRENQWSETAGLYRASGPRLLQFLYRPMSLAADMPPPRHDAAPSNPRRFLRVPNRDAGPHR